MSNQISLLGLNRQANMSTGTGQLKKQHLKASWYNSYHINQHIWQLP